MKLGRTLLILLICILIALALLCHIIALATDHWLQSDSKWQRNFLNIGLFRACFDDYIHPHENPPKLYSGCHDLYSEYYNTIRDWILPSWLVACRVLAVIALILELVGVVIFILILLLLLCKWLVCTDKEDCCERWMMFSAPVLFIVAGIFIVLTVMIFGDNAFRLQCKDFWLGNPNHNHLSYSWGFEIVAAIFALLSGGFLVWLGVLRSRDDI